MWTKGVFVLGLIVCWTLVCNCEDESEYNYGIGDELSAELARDYLFRGDVAEEPEITGPCKVNDDCENGAECKPKAEGSTEMFCNCPSELDGEKCEKVKDCEPEGKYAECKGDVGVCSYNKDDKVVECACKGMKKLDSSDNKCKETCSEQSGCKNGGKCEEKEGGKFCTCSEGLSGDKCETVVECEADGKYRGCKAPDGECSFDETSKKTVCKCLKNKKYNDTDHKCTDCDCGPKGECSIMNGKKTCKCQENFADKNGKCTATCSDDASCSNGGACKTFANGKFCECLDKVSGEKCDVIDDCQPGGDFENCKGDHGECGYDTRAKKAVCKCPLKKALHPTEKICKDCDCGDHGNCTLGNDGKPNCACHSGYALKGAKCEECDCGREGTCSYVQEERTCSCNAGFADKNGKCTATCAAEGDCLNGGICETLDKGQFCKCQENVTGEKCEFVKDCETGGQFQNCKGDLGTCQYDVGAKKAVCNCPKGKSLHPTEKICKDCDCGEHGSCHFEGDTAKCECDVGYLENNKKCEACVCGENEVCSFVSGVKTCLCKRGFAKNGDKCEACTCGEKGRCSFESGQKKCACNKGFAEKKGICEACDCGNGKCDFKDDKKNCTCDLSYVFKPKDEKCHKCDCGVGGTCHFEEDEVTCTCKPEYREYKKKCIECDCGERGSCELDENGKKKCYCDDDTAVKVVSGKQVCVLTCDSPNNCNGQKCEGPDEGPKFCNCGNSGLEGEICDIVTACKTGIYKECENTGGSCQIKDSKAECECYEPKKLDTRFNFCRTKCTAKEDCQHEGVCTNELCVCKDGISGDDCSVVTACKNLKCEEKDATCEYDHTKAPNTFCVCKDQKYTFVNGRCVAKCGSNSDCQNGGTCVNNLCRCLGGTSGDKCEKIENCDEAKCAREDARCHFDVTTGKPTCKCNDASFYYEADKCKAQWCKSGCKGTDNVCLYIDGVGTCNCTTAGNYYDYSAEKCKAIKMCLDSDCKGNQTCIKGSCGCPDNYKKNGDNCEPKKSCDPNPCFVNSKCEASSLFGYVRCPCDGESRFYNPNSGKCEENCFLPGQRKNCGASNRCPPSMTRKDGECQPTNEKNKCDKDCGSLGWCFKVSDTKQECRCDPIFGVLDVKKDKCVLKAKSICPTNDKDGDDKCKCTGLYKPASNGVTCELKSCSDEDVQNECKAKRAAKCVDTWKKSGTKVGYRCVCPDGYIMDVEKGCIDPCSSNKAKDECSSNGQVCYTSDKNQGSDCRCPPTFTYNAAKKGCDLSGENTFMIHNLPVLRKAYETTENINMVALSIDVIISMKQAYKNLEFAHIFNSKVESDVILCDVWLQFKSDTPASFNATLEVQRWRQHKTEVKGQTLLPPALLLSDAHVDKVTEEELTLCTDTVRGSVCGRGSICSENKCSCEKGYRTIDSTIQAYGDRRILRCEDIDECADGSHTCTSNTECVNTEGDFFCKCKPGFKKAKGAADALDKEACVGLCDPNPCNKGSCSMTKDFAVDCTCNPGYSGSFCNRKDVHLAKAGKATTVVGAVLGTLLAIVIVLIIVYILRQRKNSYSEDFTPAPRNDNAEMVERRPMRGVSNRGYQ